MVTAICWLGKRCAWANLRREFRGLEKRPKFVQTLQAVSLVVRACARRERQRRQRESERESEGGGSKPSRSNLGFTFARVQPIPSGSP